MRQLLLASSSLMTPMELKFTRSAGEVRN
uniref:Uncharacterized protein n=1 Tax=Arundo donax TaxID=35708 RepID=A0A0A8ZNL4_ARUDO